jgi:hypothetical protein
MEHLDDFFKKKMEGRHFDMKDAYWAEMEGLLDQKRRKRRFAFWWWGGALGLFLAVAVAVWWLWPAQALPIQAFPIPMQGKEYVSTTSSLSDEQERDMPSSTAESAKTPNSLRPGQQANANVAPENDQPTAPSEANLLSDNTFRTPDADDTDTASVLERQAELAGSGVVQVTTNIKPSISDFSSALLPFDPIAVLSFLPIQTSGDPSVDSLPIALIANSYSRWSWALEGGATLYPYFNGSNPSVGGMIGGAVGYQFRKDWRVIFGLNYRYRTGTFDFAKGTTIANYRFGAEEQSYFLLPDALHYLEMPVLARKTWGRHQMDGGVRLSYLLGVQGSLESSFVGEGRPESTQVEQRGWLAQDGFVAWHMDVVVGYAVNVHPRLAIWTNVNYSVPGLLDGNYPSPFGLQLQESRPLFVDLGLRFYLND